MSGNLVNRLIVKPQLARKNQIISIPKSVHVPTRPPTTIKVINKALGEAALHVRVKPTVIIDRPTPPPAPPPAGVGVVVVNRPRSLKKIKPSRSGGVRFVTPDVSNYEVEKVRNIRGRGRNKVLIIVANGPSITEAPLEMFNGHPCIDTMSINRPDERIWPTTYWAFFDQSQLRRNHQLWESYSGVAFNSTSIRQQRANSIKIKNLGGFGFSKDLMQGLHIGRSSVYAAMQIAMWLEYTHIYIFGCDMNEVNGKMHFYGVNPDVPDPTDRKKRFDQEAIYYADAAERLDELDRKKFTFCSTYNLYSFIEKFNRLDQRVAVPTILASVRSLYHG